MGAGIFGEAWRPMSPMLLPGFEPERPVYYRNRYSKRVWLKLGKIPGWSGAEYVFKDVLSDEEIVRGVFDQRGIKFLNSIDRVTEMEAIAWLSKQTA